MAAPMEVSRTRMPNKMRILIAAVICLLLILIAGISLSINAGDSNSRSGKLIAEKSFFASTTSTDQVGDPIVTITCVKPIFTLALVIDRSGSVYGNRDTYISTVKGFVKNLADRITGQGSNGTLKVIVNAFATRSVNQNDLTSSSEMVTDITDSGSRDKMLETIDEIYFTNKGWGTSSFGRTSEPDDIRKSYNPTFATQTAEGNHVATNWEDATKAIVDLRNGSFNGTEPGDRIDLMLMLTDGNPTTGNGPDHIFKPAEDIGGYNDPTYIAQGTAAAKKNVKDLRAPTNGTHPVSVRGVLVKSDSVSAMKTVFGENEGSDYFTADNFDASLVDVLDSLSKDVHTVEECTTTYVYPRIRVTVNPSIMEIVEGGSGTVGTITVQNLTIGSPLENVTMSTQGFNTPGQLVSVPGQADGYLAPYGQPGDTSVFKFTFQLSLGSTFADGYDIYAWGQLPNNPQIKVIAGIDPEPKSQADLVLNIKRQSLPA